MEAKGEQTAYELANNDMEAKGENADCIRLGIFGKCLDRNFFAQLEQVEYAFNAPDEMTRSDPQSIALIIDTTGFTIFPQEFEALPGAVVTGKTPITLEMEAEIVGTAFEIKPEGRQRKKLSRLNPTRWDWEVVPKRSGEHQLEFALYVMASGHGENIREEKALANRKVITVTVSAIGQIVDVLSTLKSIVTLLYPIGGAITGILAWFGFNTLRDFWRSQRS